jgi:hypothetical protein
MNLGMETYRRFKDAEITANRMGFAFKSDPYGRSSDTICLCPKNDDALPIYHSKNVIFSGNLYEVESFLKGIYWAQCYDTALGLKTEQRRKKSEQSIRNKRLLQLMQK